MEHLILLTLGSAVMLAAVANLFPGQPQPPQIIYMQTAPPGERPEGSGCLPLIILAIVILVAISLR